MVALRRGFKTWCENAARGYRRELGLSPVAPLDPRALAAHLDISIWTPAEIVGLDPKDLRHLTVSQKDSWSAATLRDGDESLIIVNSGHAQTRQNSSLTHEIGHIVLRHEPAKMYVTPDGLMMMSEYDLLHEEEANWFSGAVLVPRDGLLDIIKRGLSDTVAATYYGVSVSLFRMRSDRPKPKLTLGPSITSRRSRSSSASWTTPRTRKRRSRARSRNTKSRRTSGIGSWRSGATEALRYAPTFADVSAKLGQHRPASTIGETSCSPDWSDARSSS